MKYPRKAQKNTKHYSSFNVLCSRAFSAYISNLDPQFKFINGKFSKKFQKYTCLSKGLKMKDSVNWQIVHNKIIGSSSDCRWVKIYELTVNRKDMASTNFYFANSTLHFTSTLTLHEFLKAEGRELCLHARPSRGETNVRYWIKT